MKHRAYYNEFDPQAAAWIRELIKEGVVAPGDVDERSIEDVVPNEIRKYTQWHFYAGVAVWSYALRRAGWPDDREVCTFSCPCQPFSAAGKGEGFADERHLWPATFHIIEQLRPITVFGEQVSSKDGLAWIDLVQDDLEGAGYTFRAIDIPACSVGAPHRRNRFYFVADTKHEGRNDRGRIERGRNNHDNGRNAAAECNRNIGRIFADAGTNGDFSVLAHSNGWNESDGELQRSGQHGQQQENGGTGQLADSADIGHGKERNSETRRRECDRRIQRKTMEPSEGQAAERRGPTNGFWRDAEWIYCRDEKYRAIEPGTFPLASGSAARVGRLRGYGNSIVAPLAEEIIRSYLELG